MNVTIYDTFFMLFNKQCFVYLLPDNKKFEIIDNTLKTWTNIVIHFLSLNTLPILQKQIIANFQNSYTTFKISRNS